jgi:dephospho-CoA kinase
MLIIGLTGGIGSGKSEAAKQFALLGVPIVDADVIAHELTASGQPILAEISRIFGKDFITADGMLNRPKLRAHVFENTNERLKLEALLHPAIHDLALQRLSENEAKLHPTYQLLVMPLLFESNRYDGVTHKTLVIDCDEDLQIKRAMARSNMPEKEVKAMMAAQISRATRLKRADEVIENNGTLTDLTEKIAEIHKKFIKTCIVSQ